MEKKKLHCLATGKDYFDIEYIRVIKNEGGFEISIFTVYYKEHKYGFRFIGAQNVPTNDAEFHNLPLEIRQLSPYFQMCILENEGLDHNQ